MNLNQLFLKTLKISKQNFQTNEFVFGRSFGSTILFWDLLTFEFATNIILYFYLSMKTNLKRRILKQNCWNFLYCQKQTVKSSHKMESFTTSQWDCHLLHQKVHQRISVMKTNTLYLSRELCFFVVFKTKCKLKSQFPGNIECVCFHYWDSLMNFLM